MGGEVGVLVWFWGVLSVLAAIATQNFFVYDFQQWLFQIQSKYAMLCSFGEGTLRKMRCSEDLMAIAKS